MFRDEVKAYPLCAWLLCAISAPIAQVAAEGPWLTVLAVAMGSLVLCWCVLMLHEGKCIEKKWYCIVQLLFLSVAAAVFAGWSAYCWPTGNAYPVVPLVLLVLAAFSAWDGANTASRVGGVLFWLMALLFAVVLVGGAGDAKLTYMVPEWGKCSRLLPFVLLLPVVTSFIPRQGATVYTGTLYIIAGLAVIVPLLTAGTLSQKVAQTVAFPFYEYSKSLSLFGVAERFEAFVSVALTMGYYSLLSLLFSAAGHLGEAVKAGEGRRSIAACAVSAAALMGVLPQIPEAWMGCFAVIFWGILPCITVKTIKKKKVEKI